MRLRGHNHRERLIWSRGMQPPSASCQPELTEIRYLTFRCDRPQDISRIVAAVIVSGIQFLDFDVDLALVPLAPPFNCGFAMRLGAQRCSLQLHLHWIFEISDCYRSPAHVAACLPGSSTNQ